MSRRIACALAVSLTAITGWPAVADPECFDNACRMPDVIDVAAQPAAPAQPDLAEQPAAVQPVEPAAPQIAATTPEGETQEPPVVEAIPMRAAAPKEGVVRRPAVRPAPQMVVDPAVRTPARSAPPALPSIAPPSTVGPQRERVMVVRRNAPPVVPADAPEDAADESLEQPARRPARYGSTPGYVVNQGPSYGGAGVVVVAPTVYAGGGAVAVVPARPDPAWRRCQIEQARGQGLCDSASYYPYGAGGYRPTGTYRPYAATTAAVAVPNARIISIGSND